MQIEPSKARILADCIEGMAADAEDKGKESFGIHLSLDDAHMITRALSTAPTVDAVPVVRCRECEYAERYERIDGTAGYYCGYPQNIFVYGARWDRVFKPVKEPDDFCSYGLRKNQSADVRNMGEGNEHE